MKETISVRVKDLAILQQVINQAEKNQVEELDAYRRSHELKAELERSLGVDKEVVESALWVAKQLYESDRFDHPEGLSYREFIMRAFPNHNFNKETCLLEKKNIYAR